MCRGLNVQHHIGYHVDSCLCSGLPINYDHSHSNSVAHETNCSHSNHPLDTKQDYLDSWGHHHSINTSCSQRCEIAALFGRRGLGSCGLLGGYSTTS